MRLEYLELKQFRNIPYILFAPWPELNIICGENAQGKTNVLEAVWLFTGSKSFRGAKDADYIAFGENFAELTVRFFAQGRQQTASFVFGPEKNKRILLNEIEQESAAVLGGVFCAVVFSPDHLSLVKNGPEFRRRLVDQSLCQAYPKYRKALEGYGRILRQRGSLLRDASLHASLLDTLDAWDTTLLDYGSYILSVRGRYVKRLGEIASEIYEGVSSGREALQVRYLPGFEEAGETFERKELRELFAKALRECRVKDLQHGVTHAGPHRDDIGLFINGRNARAFGSQGQQRSVVLALKLAECRILEESCGEPPVVLLDDVMSELDEARRGYLLHQLGGRQIIITCCDDGAFAEIAEEGRVFRIKKGSLTE